MRDSRILAVILALSAACAVLAGAIALPILARPFYYAQISSLALEEYTGLRREEIITAYDEMMDFCLGLRGEFSTGILPWSPSGRAHFEDVRALFQLDLWVLVISVTVLVTAVAWGRMQGCRPRRLLGRGAGFWAGAGLMVFLGVTGALAALDFDRAFTVFHLIFFPGKDNWVFDWRVDAVILILPQEFFRNCALLIGGALALACGGLMLADTRSGGRPSKS